MFDTRSALGAAAIAAALACAGPASAETAGAVETLRVNNRSGFTLVQMFASPVTDEYWGDDVLGDFVVPSGRHASITIRNVTQCNYDMLMVFDDGDVLTEVVDVCNTETYTIKP